MWNSPLCLSFSLPLTHTHTHTHNTHRNGHTDPPLTVWKVFLSTTKKELPTYSNMTEDGQSNFRLKVPTVVRWVKNLIEVALFTVKARAWSQVQCRRLEDPVLPSLWSRSQLWLRFSPWPRNFHMSSVWSFKKKKKKNFINSSRRHSAIWIYFHWLLIVNLISSVYYALE